jgi:hypothetical protein
MAEHEVARAIYILVGLFVFLCFLYGPWQTFVSDLIRQQLFEVRDHIFDAALTGGIPFDDPAYVHARQLVNAQIRFAHKATIWRVAASAHFVKRLPAPSLPASNAHAINSVKWAVRRSSLLSIVGLWLRSPFLIVVSLVFVIPIALATLLSDDARKDTKRIYHRVNSTVAREALAVGG